MLLFNDGFDHYGPDAAFLLNGVYAESNGVSLSAVNPRTGTRAARINAGANDAGLRRVLVTGPETVVGCAYAFSINKLPTDNRSLGLFQWRNDLNGVMASVWVTSTGQVVIVDGGRGGTTISTSLPVVFPGAYQHFEAVGEQGGAVEVRINGVTVATAADGGIDAPIAQVKIGANSFPLSGAILLVLDVDDLNVWSGAGDVNNDFMGDVKVYTRFVASDGEDQEWTPAIGTDGFAMLDNVPPVDATEYVSAAPDEVPARSTFGIAPFPDEIVAVRGVMLATRAFKTDAGNAKVRTGVRSGADEDLSVEHAISQAPIWYSDVFEVDPATGTVWTPPALNTLNTVLERTE